MMNVLRLAILFLRLNLWPVACTLVFCAVVFVLLPMTVFGMFPWNTAFLLVLISFVLLRYGRPFGL